MQSPHSHSNRELFFVLQNISQRFHRYLLRMESLNQAAEDTQIANVNIFYKEDRDLALVCLGFDSRYLDPAKHKQVLNLATEGGFSVIDPHRLSPADRGFFYQDYLRRFAVCTTDHQSPTTALQVLGRQLGLVEEATAPRPRRLGSERQGTPIEVPLSLAQPKEPLETAYGNEPKTKPIKPMPPITVDLSADDFPGSEDDLLQHMGLGPAGNTPNPRGKGKRSQRLSTIPARPSNSPGSSPRLKLALPPAMEDAQPAFTPTRKRSVSSSPLVNNTGEQEAIRVRYQRGDNWMPARLRNLTTKDIRLAASAAPPAGSTLRVSVTIGEQNAVLSGTVVEVINTEGSVDGSTTFRLDFGDIGKRERERLVLLLRKAKQLGMTLTPPPARRDRRFAISWPIAVVSEGRRFNASALDISERGLFLATTTLIRSNQLIFGIPLDRDSATVKGRASVARKVNEHMARYRGLSLGYGLQIEDFSIEDDEQYSKFLIRVRRRSQLHILVAGDGDRSEALANCFQSAGYAVSTASSVEAMMHRTQFESSPPNVAVLDPGFLSTQMRHSFESTFREYDVPLLHAGDLAPHMARNRLDTMVEI